MDGLVIVLIVVFSVLVPLLFWGGIAWLGVKAVKSATDGGFPSPSVPFGDLDPQFVAMMNQLQALIAQAQSAQGQRGRPAGGRSGVPAVLQQQFNAQLMATQMQMQMHQFDELSRARHDAFTSDLLGQASAAGLDVSSWR